MKKNNWRIMIFVLFTLCSMYGMIGCQGPPHRRQEHPVVEELQDIELELRKIRRALEEEN